MELADDLDAPAPGAAPPRSAGAGGRDGAGRPAGRGRVAAAASAGVAAAVLAAGAVGLHERRAAERSSAARVSALSLQASSPRLTSDAVGGGTAGAGALVGASLPLLNAGPRTLVVRVLGFDAAAQRTAGPAADVVLEPGTIATVPLDLRVRCEQLPTPQVAADAGDPRTRVLVRVTGPGGPQLLALPTPRPLHHEDSLPAQLARACAGRSAG